jgi:RimJ/RimL family protein N-acetyltransferase
MALTPRLRHHAGMIFGERVRLRRVEREDLPRFVVWLNDPEVRRQLAIVYPLGMTQQEGWFEAQLKAEAAVQPYAVDVRSQETAAAGPDPAWTHVGGAGFHTVDWPNRSAELGLVIGNKLYWHQGYGTEATRALVRWGFRELNLNRVWLRVFEDNAAGIRCYEKTGFRLEGRLRQDRYREGRYLDTLVMGVLRDEFLAAGL